MGNFWRSLPGMITATAGAITAVTGLVVALNGTGMFSSRTPPPADAPPADVTGQWQASVTYGWGATHNERFTFQADGERLTGTTTFLGYPRPLTQGVVKGSEIRFVLALEEVAGDERRAYQLRYTGVVVNGGLHFRVEDSRGNVDLQFAATRVP